MKVCHTVRTAMKALQRNPMRALLTTLGIVIGVAAVIAMMEIGTGSRLVSTNQSASSGSSSSVNTLSNLYPGGQRSLYPTVVCGYDLTGSRRGGDHEHHARLSHRTDPRDRASHGRRSPGS